MATGGPTVKDEKQGEPFECIELKETGESQDKTQRQVSSEDTVKVLVLGKKGSGKTTLVRSFIGGHKAISSKNDPMTSEEESTVRKDNESGSKVVEVSSTEMCGTVLEFYDTAGLGDSMNKKLLQQINAEVVDGFNVALICIRMDEEIDSTLISALLEVSNVFGSALWERAIFVLTFANVYSQTLVPDNETPTSEYMNQQVEELVDRLKEKLVQDPRWLYSVKESVFNSIPFRMAGRASGSGLSLPTTQDWLQDLFVACMSQSTLETITASKLDQDKKRILLEASSVGTTTVVGGAAGAFIGGTVGTVMFPGVGTVVGAGIGSLIGGGLGTVASSGTVVGIRIKDKIKSNSENDNHSTISPDHIVNKGKEVLASVKTKLKLPKKPAV